MDLSFSRISLSLHIGGKCLVPVCTTLTSVFQPLFRKPSYRNPLPTPIFWLKPLMDFLRSLSFLKKKNSRVRLIRNWLYNVASTRREDQLIALQFWTDFRVLFYLFFNFPVPIPTTLQDKITVFSK